MFTIDDIAEKTGFGRSTVAAVLAGNAGKHRISDKTAKVILKGAKKLGYYRNLQAIRVSTGKTKVIGFLSSDMGGTEYSGAMLSAIMQEAVKNDYSCVVFPYDESDIDGTIRGIIEHRPTGMICRAVHKREFEAISSKLAKYGIPIVSLSINDTEKGLFVVTDDSNGIFVAVEHLYSLGHRRICMPTSKSSVALKRPRPSGFLEALSHFSLSESRLLPLGMDADLTSEEITPVLKERFFTAMVCDTDYNAMLAIQCAHNMGINVPGGLSVTGFADLAAAKLYSPPLTTVHQPFREQGVAAAKMLIAEISGDPKKINKEKKIQIVKTKLVIRASTAPIG
jgi:LacI family transcriptional regulator